MNAKTHAARRFYLCSGIGTVIGMGLLLESYRARAPPRAFAKPLVLFNSTRLTFPYISLAIPPSARHNLPTAKARTVQLQFPYRCTLRGSRRTSRIDRPPGSARGGRLTHVWHEPGAGRTRCAYRGTESNRRRPRA